MRNIKEIEIEVGDSIEVVAVSRESYKQDAITSGADLYIHSYIPDEIFETNDNTLIGAVV